MITTHRVIWFDSQYALEIPHFYLKEFKKGVRFKTLTQQGGFFANPNVKLVIGN